MMIHSMQIILVKSQDKDPSNSLNSSKEAVQWIITNLIDKILWLIKIKWETKIRWQTKINKWEMILNHILEWWIKIIKINFHKTQINSIDNRLKICLQEDLWENQEPSNCLMNQLKSLFLETAIICHRDLNNKINFSKWIRCKIRDKASLINNRIIKTLIKIKDLTRTTTTWISWSKITWIWDSKTILMVNKWIIISRWITWMTVNRWIIWMTANKWTTWMTINRWTTWMTANRWTTWMTANKWITWCRITKCKITKCKIITCLNKTIWWIRIWWQEWTKMLITHHQIRNLIICQMIKIWIKIKCNNQFKIMLKTTRPTSMRMNKWKKLLKTNKKILN